MNKIPLKYQIGGNKKSIYKSGNNLTSEEIIQIKAVYQNSNCQNQSIVWRSDMNTINWEFQLISFDKIACVGGVKLDTKELGYDCTHKDYQRYGLYKYMCNERMKNIKNFHNDETFYLFTEHKYLIKTHLNSGLVLLDQKSTPETFTCRYTNQTYSGMTNNYYIFRTVIPGSYKMNLVSYEHSYSNCSGMYIGNGNIITAGHCYKEMFNEPSMNITKITFGWKTANIHTLHIPTGYSGSIYNYNDDRDINNQWKDISIIKLPQILLDKIKDLQLETIPILINPEKTPPLSGSDTNKLNKLSLFGRTADSLEREVEINKNMFILDIKHHDYLKKLALIGQNALMQNAFDIKLENSNIITEYKKRFTCLTQKTKSMGGDSGGSLFFFDENRNIPIYIGDLLGLSPDLCDSKTTTNTNPRFGYGPVVINSAYFINWIEKYSDKLFIYDYVTKNISIYENLLKRIIINCNQ